LKEYIAVNNEYLEVKGREEKTKVRLLFSIDEMIIYIGETIEAYQ
jgi:hypothetical protein